MAILTVGSRQQYQTIAQTVAASHTGDTVAVQAGTYTNDFLTITDSITLQAVGGMVSIDATEPPPNLKGIITVGDASNAPTVTITGFELSGAAIPASDGNNGAGIRYQSGNLTLNDDFIHNNQDGILAPPIVQGTGTITVNASEFAANGAGDGYSHNLYIGDVAQFTFENSYSTGAMLGHDIKSRALNTTITGSRITDGPSGPTSYEIDLPNGGNAVIQGNTIEQGPAGQNPIIISYGEEGAIHPNSTLTVSGNTILNDLTAHIPTLVRNATTSVAAVSNNQVYGLTSAQLAVGPAAVAGNSWLATEPALDTTPPWLGAIPVTLSQSYTILSAGTAHATIAVTGSHDTVVGGAAGVDVTASGAATTVQTAIGATDTIALANSGTVISAGADLITTGSVGVSVTATGAATINGGAGWNTFTLAGQDSLASTGNDHVLVQGGTATVAASGASMNLTETAGTVQFAETGGGANQTATLVGGSATISGGAGHASLAITTGTGTGAQLTLGAGSAVVSSAGADTIFAGSGSAAITFGTGAATVNGGTGMETLRFVAGQGGGGDVINNFNPSLDTLAFQGFGGNFVATETLTAASQVVVLTDNTTITIAGWQTVPMAGAGGSPVVPQSIDLARWSTSVAGGSALLTATVSAGNDTILGGIGGVNV
ncbi:MAG: hypothetical protein M3Y41_09245, partial [Pseudomonadota bacterium]|nr:hypothetical protein [Pseudomonadota bacterium]